MGECPGTGETSPRRQSLSARTRVARLNRPPSRKLKPYRLVERRVPRKVHALPRQLRLRAAQLRQQMPRRARTESHRIAAHPIRREILLQDPPVRHVRRRAASLQHPALPQTDLDRQRHARRPVRLQAKLKPALPLHYRCHLLQLAHLRLASLAPQRSPIPVIHLLRRHQRLVVRRAQRLAEDVFRSLLHASVRHELALAEERSREAHGVDHRTAIARAEEAAALLQHQGRVPTPAPDARQAHRAEPLFVILGQRLPGRQRTGEFRVLQQRREPRILRRQSARQSGELPVAIVHRQIVHREPVPAHGAAHELVLALGNLRHHFAIGMQQIHHGAQIAPHRVEQFRPPQLPRQTRNPAVHRRVVRHRAALDKLAILINIDEDGQFIERSTVTYNTAMDRGVTGLAGKLRRPELLDPVRRNLRAMMYLLHPDGEVVTEVSKRQDQFVRGTMSGYWFPVNYLAVHDGDRQLAGLARGLAPENARLSALLEYPQLAAPLPAAEALPEDYEKWFGAVGLARIRRGRWDATLVLQESSRFFSARNGGAVINAVRFATSFFGKGQFVPDACVKEGPKYVDRKSTRLNSSHLGISYAVFC